MNEMNRQFTEVVDGDRKCELRELIYFSLVFPPVIVVLPVISQPLYFGNRRSIYSRSIPGRVQEVTFPFNVEELIG
jgi:hypothetical protein